MEYVINFETSPITDIANDIAEKYLLRPKNQNQDEKFLLDELKKIDYAFILVIRKAIQNVWNSYDELFEEQLIVRACSRLLSNDSSSIVYFRNLPSRRRPRCAA